jgi:hypothetical protein
VIIAHNSLIHKSYFICIDKIKIWVAVSNAMFIFRYFLGWVRTWPLVVRLILYRNFDKAPLPCDVGGLFSIRNIIIAENIIPFLQQIITQLKGFRLKDIVSSTIKLLPQSLKLTTTIEEEYYAV